MPLITAEANLKIFGQELNLDGLKFDENNTCILGIDNTFSLHLTYEPNSDRLYLYSPLLDGLPKDFIIRLKLYEDLLQGSMLGGQMAGGGVGVAVKEELILMHATIAMGDDVSSDSLRKFAPLFVEKVETWRSRIQLILQGIDPGPFSNPNVDTAKASINLTEDELTKLLLRVGNGEGNAVLVASIRNQLNKLHNPKLANNAKLIVAMMYVNLMEFEEAKKMLVQVNFDLLGGLLVPHYFSQTAIVYVALAELETSESYFTQAFDGYKNYKKQPGVIYSLEDNYTVSLTLLFRVIQNISRNNLGSALKQTRTVCKDFSTIFVSKPRHHYLMLAQVYFVLAKIIALKNGESVEKNKTELVTELREVVKNLPTLLTQQGTLMQIIQQLFDQYEVPISLPQKTKSIPKTTSKSSNFDSDEALIPITTLISLVEPRLMEADFEGAQVAHAQAMEQWLKLGRGLEAIPEKIEEFLQLCKKFFLAKKTSVPMASAPQSLSSSHILVPTVIVPGRYSCFTLEDDPTSEILKRSVIPSIPKGYTIGEAIGKGDCFFDSMAQCLNEKEKCTAYSAKSLRLLCHEYVLQGHPWVREAVERDGENYDQYRARLQFTADEMEQHNRDKTLTGTATWGRPDIEGRIICELKNLQLHVIEARERAEEEGMPPISHQLVTAERSKSVDVADFSDPTIVHVLTCRNHTVPVLQENRQLEKAPTTTTENVGDTVKKEPKPASREDSLSLPSISKMYIHCVFNAWKKFRSSHRSLGDEIYNKLRNIYRDLNEVEQIPSIASLMEDDLSSDHSSGVSRSPMPAAGSDRSKDMYDFDTMKRMVMQEESANHVLQYVFMPYVKKKFTEQFAQLHTVSQIIVKPIIFIAKHPIELDSKRHIVGILYTNNLMLIDPKGDEDLQLEFIKLIRGLQIKHQLERLYFSNMVLNDDEHMDVSPAICIELMRVLYVLSKKSEFLNFMQSTEGEIQKGDIQYIPVSLESLQAELRPSSERDAKLLEKHEGLFRSLSKREEGVLYEQKLVETMLLNPSNMVAIHKGLQYLSSDRPKAAVDTDASTVDPVTKAFTTTVLSGGTSASLPDVHSERTYTHTRGGTNLGRALVGTALFPRASTAASARAQPSMLMAGGAGSYQAGPSSDLIVSRDRFLSHPSFVPEAEDPQIQLALQLSLAEETEKKAEIDAMEVAIQASLQESLEKEVKEEITSAAPAFSKEKKIEETDEETDAIQAAIQANARDLNIDVRTQLGVPGVVGFMPPAPAAAKGAVAKSEAPVAAGAR